MQIFPWEIHACVCTYIHIDSVVCGLLCCLARSPTNVTIVGGAGPAAAPRPVSSHVAAELAPNSANMMTAWTDKLYTENMGIIFTNAVTPSAVASSAGMAAAVAAAAAAGSSANTGGGVYAGGGMLMNNGRQDTTDTSLADIQKLQQQLQDIKDQVRDSICLLYTSPSPRDRQKSRMPSSA